MKKINLGLALIGMSVSLLAKGAIATEDLKIATVDMQKAIQTVEAGKKAKGQLESELAKKKKELEVEEASVKKMVEEFKKQSLVMNEEARGKKQSEIQERMVKLQETHAKLQGELQQKERELTAPIVTRLRTIIGEMAKQKGYKVVLEKNENNVLYSDEKDDLTDDVIKKFNTGGGKS